MPVTALILNAPAGNWLRQINCAGDWTLMEADTDNDQERAKEVCRRCPVRAECRDWALSLPSAKDVYGICGGLTPEERRRARRNNRVRKTDPRPPGLKRCTACREEKPRTEFYRDGRTADGCQPRCKPCHSAAVHAANKRAKATA